MPITTTILDEKTWKKQSFKNARTKKQNPKTHCYVPVCINTGEEATNRLAALIKGIENEGYTYTLFLAPKNEEIFQKWKNLNAKFLKTIPENYIVEESKWRQSDDWTEAKKRYEDFLENNTNKNGAHKKFFEEDVQAHLKKHQQPTNEQIKEYAKNHSEEEVEIYTNSGLTEEDVRKHMQGTITDALSWMADKNVDNEVNIFFYEHSLSDSFKSLDNAIKNGHNMGYSADSLVWVKPEYDVVTLKSEAELNSVSSRSIFPEKKFVPEIVMTQEDNKTVIKSALTKAVMQSISGTVYLSEEDRSQLLVGLMLSLVSETVEKSDVSVQCRLEMTRDMVNFTAACMAGIGSTAPVATSNSPGSMFKNLGLFYGSSKQEVGSPTDSFSVTPSPFNPSA